MEVGLAEDKMFELAILGGGPAGTSAGVYAARKQLKTLLVTTEFGGQSIVSPKIENWIGDTSISGEGLAKKFKEHINVHKGEFLQLIEDTVSSVEETTDGFSIEVKSGEKFMAKTLFIATGSQRKKLNAKNADKFEHKGLTYCATCDGPLFSGQDVVVVGGGNAGFETAIQLLEYTNSVTLLQRRDRYIADEITVKKAEKNPKFKGILSANTSEILGDKFVTGLKYKDKDDNEVELKAGGIFVEIGLIPSTSLFEKFVELDKTSRIIVDPKTQKSSNPKIWAAGDCTDGMYHQNNIAAGDAVKAIENLYLDLR